MSTLRGVNITAREPCGCKSGIDARGHEWVRFCATHQAENDAVHARWNEERRAIQAREGTPS